jgi:predicted DNA-binding transcriptional regulator AlpA
MAKREWTCEARPELLTMKDIADMFGVKLRTVKRWRAIGLLPEPSRITGRTLRWSLDDILAWFEDRKRGR